MPRLLRLSRRDRLPVFDQLAADLQIRPFEEVRLMGRHHDLDQDHVADQIAPLKASGQPMRYRRDVRRDDPEGIIAEAEHVREHLASVADYDDDPTPYAVDVAIDVVDHVDGDPTLVSVLGELNAEPDAPYLRDGYDPALDDDGTRFVRYSEGGQE